MFCKLLSALTLAMVFHGAIAVAAEDALDEVNRYRARKGLAPFQRDEALTQGALSCADARAARRIEGHTSNDFSYLPSGASAGAAGCGAMTPDWGWHSCCDDEDWKYAGAALAWGSDGQRYMQLFVSNRPNGPVEPQYTWKRADKGWWYKKDGRNVGFLFDSRNFVWKLEDGTYSQNQTLKAGEKPIPLEDLEEQKEAVESDSKE